MVPHTGGTLTLIRAGVLSPFSTEKSPGVRNRHGAVYVARVIVLGSGVIRWTPPPA
jgi:hypothetical protein